MSFHLFVLPETFETMTADLPDVGARFRKFPDRENERRPQAGADQMRGGKGERKAARSARERYSAKA